MKKRKEKDWFKIKRYLHIGLPLKSRDRNWVEKYVSNTSNLEKHAFLPFIHRKKKVRKFRKEIAHDGTRSKLRKPGIKVRELYFANHLDSNVFSFFSSLLSKEYEGFVLKNDLDGAVTAYRQIPIDKANLNSRNRCNIDFANDVFDKIKSFAPNHLAVFILDISSFFDNLNHQILKKNWIKVIGSGKNLPKSHYNIFKNITKFSFIEEDEIFHLFKEEIICETSGGKQIKKPIKELKFSKENNAIAFCTKDELERIKRSGLIKENKTFFKNGKKGDLRTKGIPQGSPISSVLANIYMIDFDIEMNDFAKSKGGFYQRYSDNMILVCPLVDSENVVKKINSEIKKVQLEIQPSKTQEFHFLWAEEKNHFYCKFRNKATNKLLDEIPFEYLGFQFDGERIGIKSSSLAKFHRKMKRSFKRAIRFAIHNKTKTKGKIFKSRLYKRFTHLGSKRRRIFRRSNKSNKKWIITDRYDWGNFLTYANKSANTMTNSFVKSQIKSHWAKFSKHMNTSMKIISDSLKRRYT